MLYLFKIAEKDGSSRGYDTYDSAVVVAKNEAEARKVHPSGSKRRDQEWWRDRWCVGPLGEWIKPEEVVVVRLARLPDDSPYVAGDVVCSSYNAG